MALRRTMESRPGQIVSDTRGSVAIISAIVMLVLCGMAALAVDVGYWQADKSAMQGAADQAALAAAIALPYGTAAAQAEGQSVAAISGFKNGVASVNVVVNTPPTTGANAGNVKAVEVLISRTETQFFSQLFLATAPVASARAVVAPGPANTCIMALTPTGTGLLNVGASLINAINCNIYVNSASACDVALVGATFIYGYDVFLGTPPCGIAIGGIGATDKLKIGDPPAVDPYASRTIPTPSLPCKSVFTLLQLTIALTPGTYCGIFAITPLTVNLSPGVYVFTGDISGLGALSINGTDVSIVLTSANGSSYAGMSAVGILNLSLTPVTSGQTAGIALWIDANGKKPFSVIGGSILNITGAFYAPASTVSFTGLGSGSSQCTQLIAYVITFIGASTYQHNCTGLGTADVPGPNKVRE
jgi:Flp pilus assembly protein TadG